MESGKDSQERGALPMVGEKRPGKKPAGKGSVVSGKGGCYRGPGAVTSRGKKDQSFPKKGQAAQGSQAETNLYPRGIAGKSTKQQSALE